MDGGGFRKRAEPLQEIAGRFQQGRVLAGDGSHDRAPRNAGALDHGRAFPPLFAPIDGTSARQVPATRGFGDTAIDRQFLQHQADHRLVGGLTAVASWSITPAAIHASRRRRKVVAEQVAAAIRH